MNSRQKLLPLFASLAVLLALLRPGPGIAWAAEADFFAKALREAIVGGRVSNARLLRQLRGVMVSGEINAANSDVMAFTREYNALDEAKKGPFYEEWIREHQNHITISEASQPARNEVTVGSEKPRATPGGGSEGTTGGTAAIETDRIGSAEQKFEGGGGTGSSGGDVASDGASAGSNALGASALEHLNFVAVEELGVASKDGHVILLDTQVPPGTAVEAGHVHTVDHHGASRDKNFGYRNTTSKILDNFGDAETQLKQELGRKPTDAELRDRVLHFLTDTSIKKPLPGKIVIATDNSGDAIFAEFLLDHPQYINSSEARSFMRLAAFHEDFGVFGTKTTALAAKSAKAAAPIQLSEAIMQMNDDVIAAARGNAETSGAFRGSDRFNGIDPAKQRKIVDQSLQNIERIFKDPKLRSAKAKEFRAKVEAAAVGIREKAIVKPGEGLLAGVGDGLSERQMQSFLENVAVVDGSKIPPGGQFSNWGAVAASHSKPLQIQSIPMGQNTGYIISIPNGRKDLGAINERVLTALNEASGGGFVLRDSGLLFNFAGAKLPPQEVMKILAREMGSSLVKP